MFTILSNELMLVKNLIHPCLSLSLSCMFCVISGKKEAVPYLFFKEHRFKKNILVFYAV